MPDPAATPPPPDRLLSDADVHRVMVVSPHPDDVDFGVAGSAARWRHAGIDVTYVIVTDGQAGGFDPAIDRAKMPAIRHAEQRAAASCVGVDDVRFLGYVDGDLGVTPALVRDLTRLIRELRPDVVVSPSPERNWSRIGASHPDHLATGEATVQAIYPAARNPFAFPELAEDGLAPWTVRELWLTAHPTANHAVDITDHVDAKLAAILSHPSQLPDPAATAERVRTRLQATATRFGLPAGRSAESFAVYAVG